MVLVLYSVAARMPLLIYYPTLCQRFLLNSLIVCSIRLSHLTHFTRSLMQSSRTTQPNINKPTANNFFV